MVNKKGNPNIWRYARNGKQTGPKTELGKFKVSMNAKKQRYDQINVTHRWLYRRNFMRSKFNKVMEEAGIFK